MCPPPSVASGGRRLCLLAEPACQPASAGSARAAGRSFWAERPQSCRTARHAGQRMGTIRRQGRLGGRTCQRQVVADLGVRRAKGDSGEREGQSCLHDCTLGVAWLEYWAAKLVRFDRVAQSSLVERRRHSTAFLCACGQGGAPGATSAGLQAVLTRYEAVLSSSRFCLRGQPESAAACEASSRRPTDRLQDWRGRCSCRERQPVHQLHEPAARPRAGAGWQPDVTTARPPAASKLHRQDGWRAEPPSRRCRRWAKARRRTGRRAATRASVSAPALLQRVCCPGSRLLAVSSAGEALSKEIFTAYRRARAALPPLDSLLAGATQPPGAAGPAARPSTEACRTPARRPWRPPAWVSAPSLCACSSCQAACSAAPGPGAAAIQLPETDYPLWDALPEAIVTQGKLSQLQLEGVLYACSKHQEILPNGQREPPGLLHCAPPCLPASLLTPAAVGCRGGHVHRRRRWHR